MRKLGWQRSLPPRQPHTMVASHPPWLLLLLVLVLVPLVVSGDDGRSREVNNSSGRKLTSPGGFWSPLPLRVIIGNRRPSPQQDLASLLLSTRLRAPYLVPSRLTAPEEDGGGRNTGNSLVSQSRYHTHEEYATDGAKINYLHVSSSSVIQENGDVDKKDKIYDPTNLNTPSDDGSNNGRHLLDDSPRHTVPEGGDVDTGRTHSPGPRWEKTISRRHGGEVARRITFFTSFDAWLRAFQDTFKRDMILNVGKVGGLILLHYLAPDLLVWFTNNFGSYG